MTVEPITPPPGYGNSGREGASAPDAPLFRDQRDFNAADVVPNLNRRSSNNGWAGSFPRPNRRAGDTPASADPNAGRTILSNLRCPICLNSFVAYKDELQLVHGQLSVLSPCCTAVVRYPNEREPIPTPRAADATTCHLWNGYLKAIGVSRGPTLLLVPRDIKALLDLRKFAEKMSERG